MSTAEELPDQVPPSRDQRRSRRKHPVRARTVSVKRMTKRELEMGRVMYPPTDDVRPATRGECEGGARPCPWVSCRYHLYLDVQPRSGAIKLNFPDLEVEEMTESCQLDVADRGGLTLQEVGDLLNITRERIRQIEVRAFAKVSPALAALEADPTTPPPVVRRRLPLLTPKETTMPVTEETIDALLAYIASIGGGAKDTTIQSWFRTNRVRDMDGARLVTELVQTGRLQRTERQAADKTLLVRYVVSDPSVRPAPLPTSDAPPEPPASPPAPLEAPTSLEAAPVAAPEEPPTPPPAPLEEPVDSTPTPEASPVSPTPPPVVVEPSRTTEPEPLEEPPASPPAPIEEPPAPAEASAPPPRSALRLVTSPPASGLGRLSAADAAVVASTLTSLGGHVFVQLLEQAQSIIRLDQEEVRLQDRLEAVTVQMEKLREQMEPLRLEADELFSQLGQLDQQRARVQGAVRSTLEGVTAEVPSAALAEASTEGPRAEPVQASAPSIPPPGPAKASPPAPDALPQWSADEAAARGLRARDRVLLAIREGEQVRCGDLHQRLGDMGHQSISAALSTLNGIGHIKRVGNGVYTLIGQGKREQRSLATRLKRVS